MSVTPSHSITTFLPWSQSAGSFYALKTIRAHGLNGSALWDVTKATLIAQPLYASPAWWGYLKTDERARLQSVIKKAERYGYLPHDFSVLDQLIDQSDEKFFFLSRYITRNMSYIHSSPNLKTVVITFVNDRTTWYLSLIHI